MTEVGIPTAVAVQLYSEQLSSLIGWLLHTK